MDRLFLDANVLFSAAYRPNAGLLRLWELPDCVLCSSRYAVGEAGRMTITLNESVPARFAALKSFVERYNSWMPRSSRACLPLILRMPEKDAPILSGPLGDAEDKCDASPDRAPDILALRDPLSVQEAIAAKYSNFLMRELPSGSDHFASILQVRRKFGESSYSRGCTRLISICRSLGRTCGRGGLPRHIPSVTDRRCISRRRNLCGGLP